MTGLEINAVISDLHEKAYEEFDKSHEAPNYEAILEYRGIAEGLKRAALMLETAQNSALVKEAVNTRITT